MARQVSAARKCGAKRTIKMLDVPILDVECDHEDWHIHAFSPMLNERHSWHGAIDGAYVTVTWKVDDVGS